MSSAIALARSSGRLQEWRTVARMCLAYYAGCRWSDATNLRISHLAFDREGVTVTIPKSKTDQLAKGAQVFIKYADHPACPVILLQDYIAKLRYGERDGYLQPRINTSKGVQHGIWNTTVSYSTALNDLKIFLASLGLDPSRFGEHSGRHGGATAASDAGVDWPDLMLHGRWKSLATPLGYLANSRRHQKRVASALAQAHPSTSSSSSSTSVASASSTSHSDPPVDETAPSVAVTHPASTSASSTRRFSFKPLDQVSSAAQSSSVVPGPSRQDPTPSNPIPAVSSGKFTFKPDQQN